MDEIKEKYVGTKGCFDNTFSSYMDYDGSTNAKTIYHLSKEMMLISSEYEKLLNAISNPDSEMNPFELNAHAMVLSCTMNFDGKERAVKLFTMQNPITVIKHKFLYNKGAFEEIKKEVLSLRTNVDVIIVGGDVYFLTLAGERLFNMEKSYKAVCVDCITKIGESDVLFNFEMFENTASIGHNPRRFVAYDESYLEKLKDESVRKNIAEIFAIPLKDGKLDATNPSDADKIVKILCKRGMINPFDDAAMEVSSARKWE